MSDRFTPDQIRTAVTDQRWAGLARVGADLNELIRWDATLLRDARVLVPVDVQALYVPAGDATEFVMLPFALSTADGKPPAEMPQPFAPGQARKPGVHLHWAPPDALLRGGLRNVEEASRNRLGLPPLPDRWLVLRILAPSGTLEPQVKGWVLEADTAKAIPLENWPAASAVTAAAGKTVPRDELTGSAGGTISWAGVYDAVANRLSFHDPLTDVPVRVEGNLAAYLVAGWWSDPRLDPLDGADTVSSLAKRLEELKWKLTGDAENGDQLNLKHSLEATRRQSIGLKSGARYQLPPEIATAARAVSFESKALDAVNPAKRYSPAAFTLVPEAKAVVASEPRWPRSTLLHGVVYGVPVSGPVIVDQRPNEKSLETVMGWHSDDVAATFASAGAAPAERRSLQRMLSAFTGQLLSRLSTADGVVDVEQHEHAAGFASRPGGEGGVDRLRAGATQGPLAAGRAGRNRVAGTRKAKVEVQWAGKNRADLYKGDVRQLYLGDGPQRSKEPVTEVREVPRPAARFYFPLDPTVAVRGAGRSLRYQNRLRFSPDGKLQCRWPSQVQTVAEGVVDGADYIPSLGNGSIPQEVVKLAQSALAQDPYLAPWLAQLESKRRRIDPGQIMARLAAEAAFRYGNDARYDGGTTAFAGKVSRRSPTRMQVADQLRRFSLFKGVDPDPVSVTAWSQPWIPMWLEWEIAITGGERLDGWELSAVDLAAPGSAPSAFQKTITGRSPLHTGTARTLAAAIEKWLEVENQKDTENLGEVDEATEAALDRIADGIDTIDVLSATLDGIRDGLLGLPANAPRSRNADGSLAPTAPVDVARLLAAGLLRLTRARIVDAFGRTLNLPAAGTLLVPERDHGPGTGELWMRPRLLRPSRWNFRLVEPSVTLSPGTEPREASIDQIEPARMINPVIGFLLPDHMDEALEVFDTAGEPLGQLMHEPFGGGVMWEIAPGRTGPADAGPGFDLPPAKEALGLFAAGMVAEDAIARQGEVADPGQESALSAFLRAVDTTLWSVDTFANMGTEHIAGLVGRPIAVVRATLELDIDDDLAELDLSDPARRAAREAAYRDLADRAFPVRLGEITRSDDGLLGFFVDDDYSKFHVVDKIVRDGALDSGRGRGQLGQLGSKPVIPPVAPIVHRYVLAEDTLLVHPGQKVRLTLLMNPAGKAHLTSGVLPRKHVQLAKDWVQPGLSVMAPSLRVGPVLIDADAVRLPKVSVFPKDQIWTRRDTPSSWKNDPILAATQTALLPDIPSSMQEGYIRVGQKGEEV